MRGHGRAVSLLALAGDVQSCRRILNADLVLRSVGEPRSARRLTHDTMLYSELAANTWH